MRRIIAFLLFFIMLASISACQTGKPEADDTGSADLRFSQPYLSYVGKTQKEMLDAGIIDDALFDMENRISIIRKEPLTVDGCDYEMGLVFDTTVAGFDLAAFQKDPAEADHAVLTTARYTCVTKDPAISTHVQGICDAMTEAYGKEYRSERFGAEHEEKNLSAYLADPTAVGDFSDLWVVAEHPAYPPVTGWEPNYMLVYVSVTVQTSGTTVTVHYRLSPQLPDVY